MTTTATAERIEAHLAQALEGFGVEGEINRESSFADLDVDSLDLVELAQMIEEEYGVRLTGDDVKQLATLGDLVDLVATRSS
jgi:acyl carrier protein